MTRGPILTRAGRRKAASRWCGHGATGRWCLIHNRGLAEPGSKCQATSGSRTSRHAVERTIPFGFRGARRNRAALFDFLGFIVRVRPEGGKSICGRQATAFQKRESKARWPGRACLPYACRPGMKNREPRKKQREERCVGIADDDNGHREILCNRNSTGGASVPVAFRWQSALIFGTRSV